MSAPKLLPQLRRAAQARPGGGRPRRPCRSALGTHPGAGTGAGRREVKLGNHLLRPSLFPPNKFPWGAGVPSLIGRRDRRQTAAAATCLAQWQKQPSSRPASIGSVATAVFVIGIASSLLTKTCFARRLRARCRDAWPSSHGGAESYWRGHIRAPSRSPPRRAQLELAARRRPSSPRTRRGFLAVPISSVSRNDQRPALDACGCDDF